MDVLLRAQHITFYFFKHKSFLRICRSTRARAHTHTRANAHAHAHTHINCYIWHILNVLHIKEYTLKLQKKKFNHVIFHT